MKSLTKPKTLIAFALISTLAISFYINHFNFQYRSLDQRFIISIPYAAYNNNQYAKQELERTYKEIAKFVEAQDLNREQINDFFEGIEISATCYTFFRKRYESRYDFYLIFEQILTDEKRAASIIRDRIEVWKKENKRNLKYIYTDIENTIKKCRVRIPEAELEEYLVAWNKSTSEMNNTRYINR